LPLVAPIQNFALSNLGCREASRLGRFDERHKSSGDLPMTAMIHRRSPVIRQSPLPKKVNSKECRGTGRDQSQLSFRRLNPICKQIYTRPLGLYGYPTVEFIKPVRSANRLNVSRKLSTIESLRNGSSRQPCQIREYGSVSKPVPILRFFIVAEFTSTNPYRADNS
jgi:hypothetical protein